VVEHLLSKLKTLSSNPTTEKKNQRVPRCKWMGHVFCGWKECLSAESAGDQTVKLDRSGIMMDSYFML
jgi:hypothetical protein